VQGQPSVAFPRHDINLKILTETLYSSPDASEIDKDIMYSVIFELTVGATFYIDYRNLLGTEEPGYAGIGEVCGLESFGKFKIHRGSLGHSPQPHDFRNTTSIQFKCLLPRYMYIHTTVAHLALKKSWHFASEILSLPKCPYHLTHPTKS